MTRSKWLLVLIGLIVVVGTGALVHRCVAAGSQSHKSRDPLSLITRYSLEGRFDKALQEGQFALKNDPGNPAILNQIALVCLMRAKREPAQQEKWIRTLRMHL